jgi:hypothetical protein
MMHQQEFRRTEIRRRLLKSREEYVYLYCKYLRQIFLLMFCSELQIVQRETFQILNKCPVDILGLKELALSANTLKGQ